MLMGKGFWGFFFFFFFLVVVENSVFWVFSGKVKFSRSSDVCCGRKGNERRHLYLVTVGVRGFGSWLVGWRVV